MRKVSNYTQQLKMESVKIKRFLLIFQIYACFYMVFIIIMLKNARYSDSMYHHFNGHSIPVGL